MLLTLDPSKSETIDEAFRSFKETTSYWPGQVLLDYSLLLHQAWRPMLPMLPIGPGIRMLDVGTGYGLLADELAANLAISVRGVDIEPQYVEGAREIHGRLEEAGIFVPGSAVSFAEGDIAHLPCGDAEFEFTMVREVHQFVADPGRATAELYRVTKPTGFVCVSDNDDGLFLSYPEPSESFRRIHSAVVSEQSGYGGDRQMGRKLSTLVSDAGFEILAVTAMPEARHWKVEPGDTEQTFLVAQMREARARVVEAGAISSDEFDRALAEVEAEPPHEQFRFNARIVVVGRKPG